MGIEVLIPDFNGADEPLRTVMEAAPDILNHNVETIERLQKPVRKRARYQRSLDVLARAKVYAREFTGRDGTVHTKSSLMVGLGETRQELSQTFVDLRAVDCDVLTIGQYLRPSEHHLALERYYHPTEFAEMKEEALALGFKHVDRVRWSARAITPEIRYPRRPGADGPPSRRRWRPTASPERGVKSHRRNAPAARAAADRPPGTHDVRRGRRRIPRLGN